GSLEPLVGGLRFALRRFRRLGRGSLGLVALVVSPISLGGLSFCALGRLSCRGAIYIGRRPAVAVIDRACRSICSRCRALLARFKRRATALLVASRRSLGRLRVVGTLAREGRASRKRSGDRRSLSAEPRRGKSGRSRAATIGAAITAIAVIKAAHELRAANGRCPLVLQDLLHLIAPELAFLGPT